MNMNTRAQLLASLFFVYSIGICRGLNQTHNKSSRLIWYQPAEIKDFPYQLSLEMRTKEGFLHNCGASVVSEMWAITAADCIPTLQVSDYRLRAGSSIRNQGGEVYELEGIVVHPKYDNITADYDIAVLKVSKPFPYSDVLQPIKLANTTLSAGTPVTLSGWNSMNYLKKKADQLHIATLNIGDHEVCKKITQSSGQTLTPRKGCAIRQIPVLSERIYNDFRGNTGCPLATLQKQLVGIRSRSEMISHSIYTDVASVKDWIRNVTGTT